MQMNLSKTGAGFFMLALCSAVAGWAVFVTDGAASGGGLTFLGQGVLHIWLGWDHLLFVLCLSLLSNGARLIALISAFTIGHSISLALAFYQIFPMPVRPVEAMIALSIAFVAYEALRRGKRASPAAFDWQVGVVAIFGLVHGLGLASGLGELAVDDKTRLSSLLLFNLGIEAGQLLIVGTVAATMAALRSFRLDQPVRKAALYGAATAGCMVAIQRVVV